MELIHIFESICSSNGDDVAFFTSSSSTSSSPQRQHPSSLHTVGFSELNENVNIIASELYFRHNIRYHLQQRATARRINNTSASASASTGNISALPWTIPSILIVSSHPSPGEAASVLACTKLQIPFVPLSIDGPHRVSQDRVKTILKEASPKPIAAIVILSVADRESESYEYEYDENRPALSNDMQNDIMIHIDSNNDTIRLLNQFGMHRIVVVNAKDGSVIGGGGTGCINSDADFSNVQKEIFDLCSCRDRRNTTTCTSNESADKSCPINNDDGDDDNDDNVAYILYTSGSTNRNKPKAVVQTYKSILNRITWQWKTFPFVQQLKRQHGYSETMDLLSRDGIVVKNQKQRGEENAIVFSSISPLNDIVMRRTPLSFVDSIAEIYGTLLAGCPLWCPLYISYSSSRSSNDNRVTEMGMGLIDMFHLALRSGIRITRLTCLPSQLSQALRLDKDVDRDHNGDGWIQELSLVIVSGEPCPMSLVSAFETKFRHCHKALLVNLYGQTETGGDVSCAIVAVGGQGDKTNVTNATNATKVAVEEKQVEVSSPKPINKKDFCSEISLVRFPRAHHYFWRRNTRNSNQNISLHRGGDDGGDESSRSMTSENHAIDIERLKRILVPCGYPIDGHEFVIEEEGGGGDCTKIGRLHIKGPGVALGYVNNEAETSINFSSVHQSNAAEKLGDEVVVVGGKAVVLFNTMDLAFRDKGTGSLYIVGRAPNKSDEGSANLVSSTMGKINGELNYTGLYCIDINAFIL